MWKDKNTLIAILIVLLLMIIAFKISQKEDIKVLEPVPSVNEIPAVFSCDYNINVSAIFKNAPEGNSVDLNINDGERKIELRQVISASGARYANNDESFIFWNKGNTAFIQENDEIIIDNCIDIKYLGSE